MDISLIVAYAGGGALLLGCGVAVHAQLTLQRARKLEARAQKLAKSAADALVTHLANHLTADVASRIVGVEIIDKDEFLDALHAADFPTPGCGCGVCDERRLRRAAAGVKRDGK